MNKCNTCFYQKMDRDLEAPCVTCTGYSNWVALEAYFNGLRHEDFWVKSPYPEKYQVKGLTQEDYDSVSKPRHYMLFDEDAVISFEGKGIEVRDVIEKLVWKVKMSTDRQVPDWEMTPMFDSDYTQMMQYLMRFMDKNGVEDLKKARWYLDKLIDSYESDV